jgi:regulator of replication initiation timing
MENRRPSTLRIASLALCFAALALEAGAQQGTAPMAANAELARHIDELSSKIDSMRQQLTESQNEMEAMRAEIEGLRSQLAAKNEGEEAAQTAMSLRSDVQQLEERSDVMESEIRTHDQTKVESASKYPVRVTGTVLFTSAALSGRTDDVDLPIVAMPQMPGEPSGSLSATARQSIVGVDATGPHLWGASSTAAMSVDFFGGVPYADYTTAAGTVRLRTAHATLAWPERTVKVAFDQPLISPRNPTSWMTVGEPALAWSGNLWTWAPQLEYREENLLPGSHLSGEFAFIDPPAPGPPPSVSDRIPDGSENSRQPGYEARLSENRKWGTRDVAFAASGFYSRQAFGYGAHGDAWAGAADWVFPLAKGVDFSGELYRGRSIGGLGGGTFKNYASYDGGEYYRPLDAEGGWGQVKFTLSPELEANVAMGQDNAFEGELRDSDLAAEDTMYVNLARNQTAFANLIYRPRTYLLFSAEYRQIRSWPIAGDANRDHIVGLAAGYMF